MAAGDRHKLRYTQLSPERAGAVNGQRNFA